MFLAHSQSTLIGFSTFFCYFFGFDASFRVSALAKFAMKDKMEAMLMKTERRIENVPINNLTFLFAFSRIRHFAEFKATLLVFKYNHNGKLSILVFSYFGHFSNCNLTCSSFVR